MNNINRIFNLIKRLIFGPIFRFLFIKLALSKKFLFLNTNTASIGHLCIDVFCFLREKTIESYSYQGVILASNARVANLAMSEIWDATPGIVVIKNRALCFMMDYLRTYKDTSHDCSRYAAVLKSPGEKYKLFNFKNDSNQTLSIGRKLLSEGGLLFDQFFPGLDINKTVVLHARDSCYDQKTKNPNRYTQANRNSPVESYSSILKYLKDSGYEVIRIGDFHRNPIFDKKQYHTLDGTNKRNKDLLEVYLANQSAMFLGSSSGALAMAQIWNRPVFALNVMPYASWRLVTANSMSIPKLISKEGKILTFREIYEGGFHLLELDKEFIDNDITISDNIPDDCLSDFVDFYEAFVLKNEDVYQRLINSAEQAAYTKLCPKDCHDYYAQSLIPINFIKRYKLI